MNLMAAGTTIVEDGDRPNAVCSRGIVFGCALQKDSEKNAWFSQTGGYRFGGKLLKPMFIEAYQKEISNTDEALVIKTYGSFVSYLELVDIIEVVSINDSETSILCKIRNKDGSFGYAKFNIEVLLRVK